ncbi:MAG: CaiB/BaiF CoA-transferase family protein [Myxococcota bacterium]|nr:CaiB/BaiF CoA-transferase family protein [Myxococcota bacterium]
MKIGEIIGNDRGDGSKPLDGIRILAIEQMQALPFATQLLGHLGAEVVKVEHPITGDSGRGSLPAVHDIDGRDVGATYLRNSLSKKSIAVDLKNPEGVNLIKKLSKNFDIVAENFKPGTMKRLGLGYEDLTSDNESLVYVSVSGFGNLQESPYAHWPAYASIAEGMAGFYEIRREPDQYPRIGPSGALGDIGSALFAAIGILAALRHRDATGKGQYVDISMFDAMVSMADIVPFFLSMGVFKQKSRVAGIVNTFKADDGFFIAQAVRPHQLELFSKAVGHEEWLEDPRFADRSGWQEHFDEVIQPAVEEWAKGKTMLEACNELTSQGLAAGPCVSPEHVVSDPHVNSHNMLIEVPRPDSDEPLLVAGNPVKMSSVQEGPVERWPTLGEHTDAVLRADLGIDDSEIARLRDTGAIGGDA